MSLDAMKSLLFLFSLLASLSPLPVHAQPVKQWEVKLTDAKVDFFQLDATGADGSAILNASTPINFNGKGIYWVSGDGKQVSELSAQWDQYAGILFVSSQQLLTRVE